MKKTISIDKTALREMVQQAVKARLSSLREAKEDGEKNAGVFASKVDKLVETMIDDLNKLIEEGEKMVSDLEPASNAYAVQERNHAIMSRVGILKAIKGRLSQVIEDLHRNA